MSDLLEMTGKENGYTFTITQLTDNNALHVSEFFTFMTDSKGKVIEYYTETAQETLNKLYSYIKPNLKKEVAK